jgi:hypothetical protein
MVDAKRIKELRKNRRLSLRALPVGVGCFAILLIVLFLVNLLVPVPGWIVVLTIAVAGFSLVGDLLNIAYIGWALHRIESQQARPVAAEPDADG